MRPQDSDAQEPKTDLEQAGEEDGVIVVNGERLDENEGANIDHVSFLSHTWLWWVSSLIRRGYRSQQLETSDLWRLRTKDDPEPLADELRRSVDRLRRADGTLPPYAMWRVGFRMFRRDLVVSGLLQLAFSALRFGGPVLLRQLVLELEAGTSNGPRGYALACGLFLTQALSTLCQTHANFLSISVGLRAKNALSLAVFRHVLQLDQEGRQRVSDGQVVNLVSTDTQVALELLRQWNRVWTAPFVLIACIAYIYLYVGYTVFFGLLLMVLFVPASIRFGKEQTRLQRGKMVQTDARVKLVNEMMLGVKVLKLNAWEEPLLKTLESVRELEMRAIRRLHYYRGITLPFAISIPNVASVITFGAFILMGNPVTPADTFAVVSAFVIMRSPFVTLPLGITMITRALVSGKRFSTFFELPTTNSKETGGGRLAKPKPSFAVLSSPASAELSDDAATAGEDEQQVPAVYARNASFAWSLNLTEGAETEKEAFHLRELDFEVQPGELVGVVGRIGAGKSSLISALLGEMRPVSGEINARGKLALCTQEPFIMNRTVRENILFESGFDEERYNSTLEACALVSDLAILPASDLTEIGERGINVSGGQKARISLARAVYSKPDVIFLDDPLSAVDAHVGKHIFKHCISNGKDSALRGSTRIFVTNQLHLLDQMDRVILLEDGRIAEQGLVADLLSREGGKVRALQERYALEQPAESAAPEGASALLEGLEKKSDPQVEAGGAGAAAAKALGTAGIRLEDKVTTDKATAKGKLVQEEARQKGQVSSSTVKAYWLAGTGQSWVLAALVVLSFFVTEAVFLSIDSWLAFYSQQEAGEVSERTFLGVYFGITVGFFLVLMLRALAYAAFSIEACKTLYAGLQRNVFLLPMTFFWATPLGRVLNRLSKDTNDVDVMLPQQMQWLIMTLVRVLGIVVLISFTVPEFLAAVVPFMLIYLGIREYYRRSSVSAQRIESVLRSPVYSHLAETLQGSSTLKAFDRTGKWLRVARSLVGRNHRAHFALEAIQVWLSMRLEMLGALIVLVTAVAIVATEAPPGLAGLAIAYSLNIVINLNISVQMATQVESKLNAVERIVEYSSIRNEEHEGGDAAPVGWPVGGKLDFIDVALRYRATLEPAIRGVNFSVPAGRKVGIVGATGSGKSTLMVALFRLAPISEGRIEIDGQDISLLTLKDLRSAITCIPQDPVLFTATLRKNLDPFDIYSEEEVQRAVAKAHLNKLVDALPEGLDSQISQGGENLSVGQRQLVCIARAVLRQSKIVMLDEATASIDHETDALIQTSIRNSFPGCTMLVIAHRLDTILDLDMCLVMDKGVVAEFDRTEALLDKPDGKLAALVKAASSST